MNEAFLQGVFMKTATRAKPNDSTEERRAHRGHREENDKLSQIF
jgi:hypothetical protein